MSEARAEAQSLNLKAGTKAQTTEGNCVLAFPASISTTFLANSGPPAYPGVALPTVDWAHQSLI